MKKGNSSAGRAAQMRRAEVGNGWLTRPVSLGGAEERVYRAMREQIPVLDAAVGKLVRLCGGFTVSCADKAREKALREFLKTVPVGRGQVGIDCFLSAYLDSFLTSGRAVGEIVLSGGAIAAVCWGDAASIEIEEGETPLDFYICQRDGAGQRKRLPYQELLLFSARNPEPGHPYGVSLFRSMPALSDVLMQIYRTIGLNWERAGNVRYALVCKPTGEADRVGAQERAAQMAGEWSRAMAATREGEVRDFVAVGDVDIRVIGADGPILNSEVPVRQLLEQLVAATGLPPFLLGLSWSSTERMSAQQADLLTSEIWAIRRAVQPAIERVIRTYLALDGSAAAFSVDWEDVSLQDILDEAHAALYRAQAEKLKEDN